MISIFLGFFTISYILYGIHFFLKILKGMKGNDKNNKDPFVLCFRKTRTEMMIISKVEEISKKRDIRFLISSFYYDNEKSIKGSVYVITSKVIYKLFFNKQSLITNDFFTFKTFITKKNKFIYNSILNYLNKDNYTKQKYHTEFYTWPHYYMNRDYQKETKNLEEFLKTL